MTATATEDAHREGPFEKRSAFSGFIGFDCTMKVEARGSRADIVDGLLEGVSTSHGSSFFVLNNGARLIRVSAVVDLRLSADVEQEKARFADLREHRREQADLLAAHDRATAAVSAGKVVLCEDAECLFAEAYRHGHLPDGTTVSMPKEAAE